MMRPRPRWSPRNDPPPSSGITGWWPLIQVLLDLSAPSPALGMGAHEVGSASVHLAPSVALAMADAGISTGAFSLPTTAALTMVDAGISRGAFSLPIPALLAMAGTDVQTGAFQLAPSMTLALSGGNVEPAAFALSPGMTLGMGGGNVEPAAFSLSVTPSLAVDPGVYFDTVGAGYVGAGTPSWLHTITGNGVVVFIDTWVNSSSPTVTAKIGSTPMTPWGAISNYYTTGGDYASVYAFVLKNPPIGSQTVSATCSGTTPWIAADSLSYFNVDSFGAAVTHASATANPSMSVLSALGQRVAQAFGGYIGPFSAYSQTQRYNQAEAFGNLAFVIGDALGASSLAFSATSAYSSGGIAIPVVPA